jgi:hypothetical protein
MRPAGERWIQAREEEHHCGLPAVVGGKEVVFGTCFGCALRNG